MLENQGNSIIFYAHYTTSGVSTAGLTVAIDVYKVVRAGAATQIVTDGACTEIGDGVYSYLLAAGSVDAAAEYIGVFHTATATVDAQNIPAMWSVDRAGTEKLDSGVTLESSELDGILDVVIVDTYTLQDILKIMAGVLAGKVTGGGTTEVTFRGLDDTSDIVVATVDADGNRSIVTVTV